MTLLFINFVSSAEVTMGQVGEMGRNAATVLVSP
jgi:hypothetical protein